MDALKIISEGSIKAEKPQFNVGDTVRVDVRIKEGDRERIQAFEGTVIAKKHGGVAETFTVRRVAYGVGIERVFPINSPFVEKVTVVRKGKVRRAKLFYLRGRTGKAAPVQNGRKGTTCCPFFLYSGPDKIVRCIGKWKSMLQHRKLCADRMCLSGTRR